MSKKEQVEKVLEMVKEKKTTARKPKSETAKQAEKVAKEAINSIAEALPHGQGKRFLEITNNLDVIDDKIAMLNKQKRGERAALKELKVDLAPYDHVRRLRKKEPEDMQSFEASVALYKDQLGMKLSVHQEVLKKQLTDRREAARDVMLDASGGTTTGKEIGSRPYGAASDPQVVAATGVVPSKNDAFSSPTPPASTPTH